MKIVLDTSVIISAFATRGLCSDTLELCLAKHKIVISHFILQEVHHALTNKLKLPHSTADNIQSFLSSEAEIINPVHISNDACRDKNDLKILGTAVGGKTDAMITGDNDLLILKEFNVIPILSPRQFWNLIKEKKDR